MQLLVEFLGEKAVVLSVEHSHLLQAVVYHEIDQPAFRSFLHEQSFVLGRRHFKLFTFSRLMGKFSMDREKQRILFTLTCRLVIASPLPLLMEEMAKGFLRRGQVRLGENTLAVGSVQVRSTEVTGSSLTVRMLSPLTVYSTLNEQRKPFTYYSPFEPRFANLVRENLAKKYQLVFGQEPELDGFSFTPLGVREGDLKVIRYKGTIVKGWMGKYRLSGDPRLLELALIAGLGSKNSQGFGCCEPVRGG